eukprot:m.85341 g.85341  ORF g.85341 m.85341 type:complete len:1442 (+) comp36437_c0_seq28:125-4450(+)
MESDPLFKEIVLPSLPTFFSQLDLSRFLYDLCAADLLTAEERDELLEKPKTEKQAVLTELFSQILPNKGLGTFGKFVTFLRNVETLDEVAALLEVRGLACTVELANEVAEEMDEDGSEMAIEGPQNSARKLRLKADPEFGRSIAVMDPRWAVVFACNPELAEDCGVDSKLAQLFETDPILRNKLSQDMELANLFFESSELGRTMSEVPEFVSIFHRNSELAKTAALDSELVAELAKDPDEKRRYLTAKLVVTYGQNLELAKANVNKFQNQYGENINVDTIHFKVDKRIADMLVPLFNLRELLRQIRVGPGNKLLEEDVTRGIQQCLSRSELLYEFVKNAGILDRENDGAFRDGLKGVRLLAKNQGEIQRMAGHPEIAPLIKQAVDHEKNGGSPDELAKIVSKILDKGVMIVSGTPEIARRMLTEVNAHQIFERAKKEGMVTVVRARVHLVGKDGAGKTCVKNALLSKKFVEDQASTPGIATDVAVCQAETKSEDGAWALPEAGQTPVVIAGALKLFQEVGTTTHSAAPQRKDSPRVSSSVKGTSKPAEIKLQRTSPPAARNFPPARTRKRSELTGSATGALKSRRTTANLQGVTADQNYVNEIAESFSESNELREVTKKMKILGRDEPVYSSIILWDEGGQEQYLNMQTPFIAEDATHLLVFDLTQDPNSEVKFTRYRHRDGTTIEQPSFGFKNHGGVLLHWLSMLVVSQGMSGHALSKFLEDEVEIASGFKIWAMGEAFSPQVTSPPCILVGTRAHSTSALIQSYQQFLKELFDQRDWARLLDHIVESEENCSAIPGHPDNLLFFPVECNHASKEEIEAADRQKTAKRQNAVIPQHPNFAVIRRKIMSAAQNYWKERKIPKKWLILQLLSDHVSKKRAIVHRDFLFPVAQKACEMPDEKEFKYALMYLDALGMIIYKPESKYRVLKDHIITDPSWLFELFSRFLPMISQQTGRVVRLSGEELYPGYPSDLVAVQTHGIMSSRLVKYFLDHVKRAEGCKNQMLKLLQDFDVIAQCGREDAEGTFYVPCLVQKRLENTSECFINKQEGKQSYTSPLVLKAGRILIWPEPLFFRLVTRFLNIFQPKKVLVERHRVVINNIDASQHMMALEFVYLDPKYVAATVRFRVLKDDTRLVKKKCRELRQKILTELNDIKKLGFQSFDFYTCMAKNPRSLPAPKNRGDDMYINLEENLLFKKSSDDILDVYFRAEGDDELLGDEFVSELQYWYGPDEEEETVGEGESECAAFPMKDDEVTRKLILAISDAMPYGRWEGLAKELQLSDDDLERVSQESFKNSTRVVKVIETWQRRQRNCVGLLLDACNSAGVSVDMIKKELIRSKPKIVFPPDDSFPTREVMRACASVGSGKWDVIGMNLLLSAVDLNEIEESTKPWTIRLFKVLETWQQKTEFPTIGKLVNALQKAGINRKHLEKNYLEYSSSITYCRL